MSLRSWFVGFVMTFLCLSGSPLQAQKAAAKKAVTQKPIAKKPAPLELTFPPTLPSGQRVVTDTSNEFLNPTESIGKDVLIVKTAPTVDFLLIRLKHPQTQLEALVAIENGFWEASLRCPMVDF